MLKIVHLFFKPRDTGLIVGSSSAILLSVDLDCSLKSSQKNSIERLISLISDSVSDRFGVSGVAGS